MTVAISLNLSDGVILGVDSAVSIPGKAGIAKTYENAEKLFQIGRRPIGVAIFGLGGIGARSIGSYLTEFGVENNAIISAENFLEEIVEALRSFFMDKYSALIIPALEKAIQEQGKKLEDVPKGNWPKLGLVIGGFSSGAYLSEVWEIYIPRDDAVGSAKQRRKQGNFGTNWFSLYTPIQRYMKGIDVDLLNELMAHCEKLHGSPYSDEEKKELSGIIKKYDYTLPFAAMPIQEGVAYTRFLVEFVINHYRYISGHEVVGGKSRLGMVTYRGGDFQLLDDWMIERLNKEV